MPPSNHPIPGIYDKLSVVSTLAQIPVKYRLEGHVTRIIGLTIEVVGIKAAVGEKCLIGRDANILEAEVVGFAGKHTYLMPSTDIRGIIPGARVVSSGSCYNARVGPGLLGRVIDSRGEPIDGKGPLVLHHEVPLTATPINPYEREPINQPLDVGIRSINGLLPIGRGQRIGLFAGSGVGKSVLLGMMTKYTSADVIVYGTIGERGREVREFVENILGTEGMSRSVVIASPADTTPMQRLHGAMLATSIAEYFRDQNKNVLLLMDSLTRYAQAQREVALAVGEPPATRGYPPSVFAKIPQLVERSGNGVKGRGSITAIYTVLMEGDDHQDPVADAARAILDGHFVLSRELSDKGHYPAIDIEASVSRVVENVSSVPHINNINIFKEYYSLYMKNRDMINVGAYDPGSDRQIDRAIELYPDLVKFLRQRVDECITLDQTRQDLDRLVTRITDRHDETPTH